MINPAAGAHTYNQGDAVTVTATPNSGYTFSGWSGACTGNGACSVTMDADKTVTANFAVINYDLTVVANPAGGGTTNPAVGVHPYAYGSVVNVTAAPLAGYAFSSWSGACTGSGACSVTMDGTGRSRPTLSRQAATWRRRPPRQMLRCRSASRLW